MLSSITPLGERGRGRRWEVTVAAFTLGSVAGGAALGWLLARIGALVAVTALPAPAVLAAAAFAAVVGFLADLGLWHLPTVRRQVNEDWLDAFRSWVVGIGFGAQLGAGLATIVTTAAVHLVFTVALLAGDVRAGLAIGAVFGLARALPLVAAREATGPAGLAALHAGVERMAPFANRLTTALLAVAALAFAAASAGL
jgi:hypothetical protein